MNRFRITRRHLLGVAATTAVTGLALARDAHVLGDAEGPAGATGSADVSGTPRASEDTRPVAAWLDGLLTGEDLALANAALTQLSSSMSLSSGASRSRTALLQPKVLEPDLVWQWRRGLAEELASGIRAVAITRWDKALLLNDLAREASLPVRYERIGHSLFQTEIG
jgi:hypothetical protein